MVKLIVQTPEGVEIRQDLAGAGSRFAAAVVDGLAFLIAAAALGIVFGILFRMSGDGATQFLVVSFFGGLVLIGLAYPFFFGVYRNGQTPGKSVVGIRVVSADGSPAQPVQHLLRSLILLVDILPVPVSVGFWLMAITPRHTRLGDLAAGTIVLRVPDDERAPEPRPNDRWSTLTDRHLLLDAHAARVLDPRDVAFLRDVVTRRDIDEHARRALFDLVANAYCAKLAIARPPPPVNETVVVRELYVFAREFVGEPPSPTAI